MTMPWDRDPYRPPPQNMKPDVPRPPSPPAQPAQRIPVTARNPQTGQRVNIDLGTDLRAAIQQAVNQAVGQSAQAMAENANNTLNRMVKKEVRREIEDEEGLIEKSLGGGPATTRTFIQGAILDIGAAVFAVVATMVGPDFNAFDREAWTIVGVMMVKTVIQTGLSYLMKFKAS